MFRIDELLGVATFAAAAMVAAIAITPAMSGAAVTGAARVDEHTVTADQSDASAIVVLPSVDVVARRSVEMARIELEEALDRQHLTKRVEQPGA